MNIIKKYNYKLIRFFIKLRVSLNNDRENFVKILDVYSKSFLGEASSEQISLANKALRNILKKMGVGSFLVLVPFSIFMFPFILKISRYYGVELLPEEFIKKVKKEGTDSIDSKN